MAHPVQSKGFLQKTQLCTVALWGYPPTSQSQPFYCHRAYLPQTLQEVMSGADSLMACNRHLQVV